MSKIITTIATLIIVIILLAFFWYFYNSHFRINLKQFSTKESCVESIMESQNNTVERFKEKALSTILGDQNDTTSTTVPQANDAESWKPSLRSLKLLLDPDAIVTIAMANLRSSLAKKQNENPESIINNQAKTIVKYYEKALVLCDSLPSASENKEKNTQ